VPVVQPLAAFAGTIIDRSASDIARRAHPSNCARSSLLSVNDAVGSAVLATHRF
jgi:hypothetical protein